MGRSAIPRRWSGLRIGRINRRISGPRKSPFPRPGVRRGRSRRRCRPRPAADGRTACSCPPRSGSRGACGSRRGRSLSSGRDPARRRSDPGPWPSRGGAGRPRGPWPGRVRTGGGRPREDWRRISCKRHGRSCRPSAGGGVAGRSRGARGGAGASPRRGAGHRGRGTRRASAPRTRRRRCGRPREGAGRIAHRGQQRPAPRRAGGNAPGPSPSGAHADPRSPSRRSLPMGVSRRQALRRPPLSPAGGGRATMRWPDRPYVRQHIWASMLSGVICCGTDLSLCFPCD